MTETKDLTPRSRKVEESKYPKRKSSKSSSTPSRGPKITKVVSQPSTIPIDIPSPKVLHSTRELKTYLSQKLYVYHKQLEQLNKYPELAGISIPTIHNIQGKLDLIEDLRRTYGWDELRKRPPVSEMLL